MQSPLLWVVLAVLLFWSVGAYNRLVRLRRRVVAQFAALHGRLAHYLELADTRLREAAGLAQAQAVAAAPGTHHAGVWMALQGACTQFEAALQAGRRQPLDAAITAALRTAHDTLHVAWQRVQEECARHPMLAEHAQQAGWQDNHPLVAAARDEFNEAVRDHNRAISQFPALLLAHLFGFRSAGTL